MRQTQRKSLFRAIFPFLLGFLTGLVVGLRLAIIALWRWGGEAFLRRMAQFNKHWTNRAAMLIAGRRGSPYAIIRHVGRHSGRAYATPVILASIPGGFVIPLAYGNADWYRNIQSSGGCKLEWQGKTYSVGAPERVDASTVLQAFSFVSRFLLRLYDVKHFVKVLQVARFSSQPATPKEQQEERQPQRV